MDVRKKDNSAKRGRVDGLRSTYGTRAVICAHFHWTIDYLENEISWAKVLRLMADLPSYDNDESELGSNSGNTIRITEQNSEDILNQFKNTFS